MAFETDRTRKYRHCRPIVPKTYSNYSQLNFTDCFWTIYVDDVRSGISLWLSHQSQIATLSRLTGIYFFLRPKNQLKSQVLTFQSNRLT